MDIISEAEQNGYAVLLGDAFELVKSVPDESVHFVVTDPPYFIDGMDGDWDDGKLASKAKKAGVIGSLPVGMKFDKRQGERLQAFMEDMAKELYRTLKPGGFCVCFSQPRLYHRMAMAFEDAGFEIRDMFCWQHEGQAKAFSQDHFVKKSKNYTEAEKEFIINELGGRKTPQLKPQMEPMVFCQKPKDGTFVENWMKHRVGLVDTSQSLDGRFPGTVMQVSNKGKSDENVKHLTIKPVPLIEHLIGLFSLEGQTVLDPFLGSGSHGIAAVNMGRRFIGFEKEPKYFEMAKKRLGDAKCKKDISKQEKL